MAYEVFLTKKATKRLGTLPAPIRARVLEVLNKLSGFPHGLDVKKLVGFKGMYRVRVGDYRILISLEGSKIIVIDILPRSRAYRNL